MNNILRLIKILKNMPGSVAFNESINNDQMLVKLINEKNINGAIKHYRLLTGTELKEASEYVEKETD